MQKKTIAREEEMTTVAETVLSTLPQKKSAHVLALSGELGAGKTAFVRALASVLGVTEHITSPTFVIMKKYKVPNHYVAKTLVHIDAYRVEDVAEMQVIGLLELFEQEGTIICIEWPENIQSYIADDALNMYIEITGSESRTITYGN